MGKLLSGRATNLFSGLTVCGVRLIILGLFAEVGKLATQLFLLKTVNGVVHDFNNTLSVVFGYAERAQSQEAVSLLLQELLI